MALLGYRGKRHAGINRLPLPGMKSSDADFFLSGRSIRTIPLLLTTAATNFSAFTVLGLSGTGYRTGFSFYPAMAFGTGFMALGMYLIGSPLGRLGRVRGYVTPVDFISERFGSPLLSKSFAAALAVFTVPYLALQPMAAGMLLESAVGVPYRAGVLLTSLVVAFYTVLGGMRAVVRTDLVQGSLLLVLCATAYWTVVHTLGGFAEAHRSAAAAAPLLFSRKGGGTGIPPLQLCGYYLLWFMADPMFPQLSQRFLAARDHESLERTVTVYPLVTMALFFLTISMGVIGAGAMPGLSDSEADRVWPLLVTRCAGPVLGSVFMLAPLSALMSTLDSQLLSLTSIVLRDLAGIREAGQRRAATVTALIACAGSAVALFPPRTILDFLNRSSFLGYAALFPLVFSGLYSSRVNRIGALFSLIAGETATALFAFGTLSSETVPPIFIVCSASCLFLVVGSWVGNRLLRKRECGTAEPAAAAIPVRRLAVFIPLLFLAVDFFHYGKADDAPLASGRTLILGLPWWVLYHAGTCIALFFLFLYLFRGRKRMVGGCGNPLPRV